MLNKHLCQVAIDIPAELMTSSVLLRYKGESFIVAGLNRSHVSNSILGIIVDLVGLTLIITRPQDPMLNNHFLCIGSGE
jgi:hypothetical protein